MHLKYLIPVVAVLGLTLPHNSASAGTLSAGLYTTCAVINGGAVCWGDNTNGELGRGFVGNPGNPAISYIVSPGLVTGLGYGSGVTAISVGLDSVCAVQSGAMKCWGSNSHGQLGIGTSGGASSVPVSVGSPLGNSVTDIGVGGAFACALRQSGAGGKNMYCWGFNNQGSVGNNTRFDQLSPVQTTGVTAGAAFWQTLSVGYNHVCGLYGPVGATSAYCHGPDLHYQMGRMAGINTTDDLVLEPRSTFQPSNQTTQIVAGQETTCDIKVAVEFNPFCWGLNANYRAGHKANNFSPNDDGPNRSSIDWYAPSNGVIPHGATQIFAGSMGKRICGKDTAGHAYCWGDNERGGFGNGLQRLNSVPTPSCANAVNAGYRNARDGIATCGGTTFLYADYVSGFALPGFLPAAPTGVLFGDLAPGFNHTCAQTSATTVSCWGANDHGQLGLSANLGSTTSGVLTPSATSSLLGL
jgi:alpha-tubulin suppressor-like RCC1 family protein